MARKRRDAIAFELFKNAVASLGDEMALMTRDSVRQFAEAEVVPQAEHIHRHDELVPDELDTFWQLTLRFLQIARERWPQVLDEAQAMEPMARRDALITA